MSSIGAAPRAAASVGNARAAASRRNGARSRGPKTPEGKARSAQNALKHGLRAQKYVALADEDVAEFQALEAALVDELAPVGTLQVLLARRVAIAAWRLARADRIEAELFAERRFADGGLGLALVRDGNGSRSFDTLLRYRGAAMAEFWRALRTLKALQAEARAPAAAEVEAPLRPRAIAPGPAAAPTAPLERSEAREKAPNEPESRTNPGPSRQPQGRATAGGGPRSSDPGGTTLAPLPLSVPGAAAPPRAADRTRDPASGWSRGPS